MKVWKVLNANLVEPADKFEKPTEVDDYQDYQLNLIQTEWGRKTGSDYSAQNVWLNRNRFLDMGHELTTYSFETGNEGSAEGFMYEHACVILKHEAFEATDDDGDYGDY